MKFSSTNPMLSENSIVSHSDSVAMSKGQIMTLEGTAKKSAMLILLCLITGFVMYGNLLESIIENYQRSGSVSIAGSGVYIGVASIVGLIAYFVGLFVPKIAKICAPVYAIAEGIVLGAFSVIAEVKFPGVALQALMSTFAIAGVMFVGFSYGFFKVTQKLKSFVIACAIGYIVFLLANMILSLFGNGIAVLNVENQSVISYGISIFAVCLGALFLLLDFDNIAQLHGRASKDMEWVCGMGLLATLVWLYIELLKLFMKLQSRE